MLVLNIPSGWETGDALKMQTEGSTVDVIALGSTDK